MLRRPRETCVDCSPDTFAERRANGRRVFVEEIFRGTRPMITLIVDGMDFSFLSRERNNIKNFHVREFEFDPIKLTSANICNL